MKVDRAYATLENHKLIAINHPVEAPQETDDPDKDVDGQDQQKYYFVVRRRQSQILHELLCLSGIYCVREIQYPEPTCSYRNRIKQQ